jgi:hypothetical protein
MAERKDPPFTAKEKATMTWLVARMAKRGLAGEDVDLTDLKNRFDAVVNGARERAGMPAL